MRANGCGAATPQSTSRDTEIGGSHMSQKDSTGRRLRAAFSLASLVGGALAAAALSMGTAHADTVIARSRPLRRDDPYDVLFGAQGTQGVDNALLDWQLAHYKPDRRRNVHDGRQPRSKRTPATTGSSNLINAIDPSAFYEQTDGLASPAPSPIDRWRVPGSGRRPRLPRHGPGLRSADPDRALDSRCLTSVDRHSCCGSPTVRLNPDKSTSVEEVAVWTGGGGGLATSPPVQTPNVGPAAMNPGAPGVR